MLEPIYIIFIASFTLINILLSSYMVYLSIKTASKCECSYTNIYWFIIFFYFLLSGIFLVYCLFYVFGRARGTKFMYFLFGYVVATVVFAIGSIHYSKYLKGKGCDCIEKHYQKLLTVVTLIRVIVAIISVIPVLIMAFYFFVNRKNKYHVNKI